MGAFRTSSAGDVKSALAVAKGDNMFFKVHSIINIFVGDIAISISISIHVFVCNFFSIRKNYKSQAVNVLITKNVTVKENVSSAINFKSKS